MVKLIIQIPCLNEEKTLPLTLRDIPDRIDGVDVIETLVIDDGSTDRTAALSGELGVNHIIRFKQTEGLSRAFSCGLEYCLNAGADIIRE
jgi:glycosyltransferase involved in cell wall biosynthesis